MSNIDPTTLLLQLGVLLAVAFLLGRLAERVGLPATTGELATGLVLGPSLLGAIVASGGREWLFTPASGQIEFAPRHRRCSAACCWSGWPVPRSTSRSSGHGSGPSG